MDCKIQRSRDASGSQTDLHTLSGEVSAWSVSHPIATYLFELSIVFLKGFKKTVTFYGAVWVVGNCPNAVQREGERCIIYVTFLWWISPILKFLQQSVSNDECAEKKELLEPNDHRFHGDIIWNEHWWSQDLQILRGHGKIDKKKRSKMAKRIMGKHKIVLAIIIRARRFFSG